MPPQPGLPATQSHRLDQQGTDLMGFVPGRGKKELELPSKDTLASSSEHGGVGGCEQLL